MQTNNKVGTEKQVRARIRTIQELCTRLWQEDRALAEEKNSPYSLLYSYGYVDAQIEKDYQELFARYLSAEQDTKPLSFQEIASYANWFYLYPEKMVSAPQITSSRNFPITLKGSRQDIERTILSAIQQIKTQQARAKALAIKLRLMQL